jgi:hypothetical protein
MDSLEGKKKLKLVDTYFLSFLVKAAFLFYILINVNFN